ncbi:MAG: ParB N-terminal domain-containing protein [Pseudolabrys sp.]|nr:ParB N-terminal domain-containing protein [Pseudolabrys sp.]
MKHAATPTADATTAEASIAPPVPFVPPLSRPVTLPLDRIKVDGLNHRSSVDIEDLAKSMSQVGLISPVVVTAVRDRADGPEDHFLLVAGHRRFAAAQSLGWTEIAANELLDVETVTVEQIRACENLVRSDLGPLDEAMAVATVLDDCDGDVRRAALCFGRSESWVRDRSYVADLEGEARKLVAAGLLPIPQARAIARIGNAEDRDDLAHEAAATGARPPLSIDEVERRVGFHIRSLAKVPWDLDVAFGGCPTCTGCPSNSNNDPLLFEGSSFEIAVAHCSDRGCFEKKTNAAEMAITGAVGKIEKRTAKGATVDLTVSAIRAVLPTGIKEEVLQRAAKRKLDPRAKVKADAPSQPSPSEKVDVWKLESDWRALQNDKQEEIVLAIINRIDGGQMFAAMCACILSLDRGYTASKKPQAFAQSIESVFLGTFDLERKIAEVRAYPGTHRSRLDRVGEELAKTIPDNPGAAFLQSLGVEPLQPRKDYVAARVAELKKAQALKPVKAVAAKSASKVTAKGKTKSESKPKPKPKSKATSGPVKTGGGA